MHHCMCHCKLSMEWPVHFDFALHSVYCTLWLMTRGIQKVRSLTQKNNSVCKRKIVTFQQSLLHLLCSWSTDSIVPEHVLPFAVQSISSSSENLHPCKYSFNFGNKYSRSHLCQIWRVRCPMSGLYYKKCLLMPIPFNTNTWFHLAHHIFLEVRCLPWKPETSAQKAERN